MSDRRLSTQNDTLRQLLREIHDRIDRLEHQGSLEGPVSFGSRLEIGGEMGGVLIEVVATSGTGRNVVFTNQSNGLTYTITL
jgi:hypothetical protein